jgi:hypothetical protein
VGTGVANDAVKDFTVEEELLLDNEDSKPVVISSLCIHLELLLLLFSDPKQVESSSELPSSDCELFDIFQELR